MTSITSIDPNGSSLMVRRHSWPAIASLACLLLATACARAPDADTTEAKAPTMSAPTQMATVSDASVAHNMPPAATHRMVVYKSPSCGCCGAWVDHMRAEGFIVETRDLDNVNPVKERLGVPYGKGSCHTAEVDGYVIEGHVPAGDVRRLLAEKPDAKGLALPGMPAGSPGMETPDGRSEPYTVELIRRDGTTTAFAAH